MGIFLFLMPENTYTKPEECETSVQAPSDHPQFARCLVEAGIAFVYGFLAVKRKVAESKKRWEPL